MHSSFIFTIHRFAEKTKAIQDQKQLELQKAAEGHGLALKMLKEKHNNEIEQLKLLLEGRIAKATKNLTQTAEEKYRVEQSSRNKLNTLANQLQQRMSIYEEQQRVLEETQKRCYNWKPKPWRKKRITWKYVKRTRIRLWPSRENWTIANTAPRTNHNNWRNWPRHKEKYRPSRARWKIFCGWGPTQVPSRTGKKWRG